MITLAEIENIFAAMEKRIKALEEELLETKELLAISLKRNTVLEKAIFAHDEEGEIVRDSEDEPVISPKLVRGQETIIEPENDERETFIPNGKLQKAAVELIKYACSRPVTDGYKAIVPSVLHYFRKNILREDLRPETKNPREWKKEITDIVCELVPSARKDKKGNNRGIRLLFPRNFDISMTKCKLDVS